jgi:death-on-curing protein
VNYLSPKEIILINRKMVLHFGGLFTPPNNIKNLDAFNYLIEAVQSEVYGKELYPDICSKAALYLYNIISNHIFNDGTKRTGLEAALLFLEKNNFVLKSEVTNEELISFALEVASGDRDFKSTVEWFEQRITSG